MGSNWFLLIQLKCYCIECESPQNTLLFPYYPFFTNFTFYVIMLTGDDFESFI